MLLFYCYRFGFFFCAVCDVIDIVIVLSNISGFLVEVVDVLFGVVCVFVFDVLFDVAAALLHAAGLLVISDGVFVDGAVFLLMLLA